jgi:transposase
MSTTLLYHAFGVRGYKYVRSEYENGQVIFTIYQEPATCLCSCCGLNRVISRGRVDRRFRSLPIGCRPTLVSFAVPRVECQACRLVRQVDISLADPRRSYT